MSVGWYDVGLYERLHETIDRVLGAGDTRLMTELTADSSVRVARTKCCSRGDIACEFLCEWE